MQGRGPWRWAFVAAGLLLLGSQGRLCEPFPGEPICSDKEDCPENQECVEGVCACPEPRCTLFCPFGFQTDSEGCELCACEVTPPDYAYCEGHDDCACGVDRASGECAYGNRANIDESIPCPEYCTGLDGSLRVVCRGNTCVQVRPRSEPVLPYEPVPGLAY